MKDLQVVYDAIWQTYGGTSLQSTINGDTLEKQFENILLKSNAAGHNKTFKQDEGPMNTYKLEMPPKAE